MTFDVTFDDYSKINWLQNMWGQGEIEGDVS